MPDDMGYTVKRHDGETCGDPIVYVRAERLGFCSLSTGSGSPSMNGCKDGHSYTREFVNSDCSGKVISTYWETIKKKSDSGCFIEIDHYFNWPNITTGISHAETHTCGALSTFNFSILIFGVLFIIFSFNF